VSAEAGADLEELGSELGSATSSALAQRIGRTLLFYRPHPKKPRIELPRSPAGGKP
jgi:RNA-binding protein YhbY